MNLFTTYRGAKQAGFTLIELMVVIAIIGILATIITASLNNSRAKGRDAKRVSDVRTLQLALEQYYNDNGYFPLSLASLYPTYLANIPTDPSYTGSGASYIYTSYTSLAGNSLCTTVKPIAYHLAQKMESDSSSNPALNQDATTFDGTIPASLQRCNVTGSAQNFWGNAQDCSGTGPSTPLYENCYDVTN